MKYLRCAFSGAVGLAAGVGSYWLYQTFAHRASTRNGVRAGIAVGLGLGMASPATAAEPAWEPAAEAFAVGVSLRHDAAAARPHFAAAAAGFDAWWAAGNRTAAVARNRGRAHFLAGDVPRAVAAFREGLAVAPWDVGLQDDLAACRAGIPYPTETDPAERTRPDPVAGWRTRLSPADRLGFAVLAGAVLAVGVARRLTARDGWAVPVAVVGFAGLAADGWVAGKIASEEAADREFPAAVVAADGAVLRRGNGDSHAARLPTPLPAGVEVRVVGDRGGWVRVRVAGGATGWLPETAVVRTESTSLPLEGGGLGWGCNPLTREALTPHPNPPPQGGRGTRFHSPGGV